VIPGLWLRGERLASELRSLVGRRGLDGRVACLGLPPRTAVVFHDADGRESLELKSLFQQECLRRGVLFTGSQFISAAHSDEDIERTLGVYDDVLAELADAIAHDDVAGRLEGRPVQPVFRQL
jgi:glutamate-1-semialdehyde aminotransferase